METVKHYLTMGLLFISLFTVALFSLELFEGRKISTTLYVGLNNGGFSLILVLSLLLGFVIFLFIFLPLTFILDKFLPSFLIKLIVFSAIGCLGGIGVFNMMYGFQGGYLITEYDLNIDSSILIFGLAGLSYALFGHHLKKRTQSSKKCSTS